ncbi:helix-turn-helix domain-containing protein [Egibacter rhizosphaerae]|uniref:Helix-turn-helix domain-containing protein n=1 Tax=Egibacter rhizosphaerae TaxID=1670831 RepID=A0A411YIV2_9ACTN|nr:helix-turn-helix domain-containing protein [Egibacter rhizosphaerae]QBI21153.1 helix-turn-helix domain-containing protein [Egibacter rhizosphaerae]
MNEGEATGGTIGARLRARRHEAGWSQVELAAAAGVSRQLVGAVEAGRHLPRVDAGAALARALGTTVEALLEPGAAPVPAPVLDEPLPDGRPVRIGRVGDRTVAAPLADRGEAWDAPDGTVEAGRVHPLPGARPGLVVVGCDPAVELAARLASGPGDPPPLALTTSTDRAVVALGRGRAHAAVVHAQEGALPRPPVSADRQRLACWRVGLAAPRDAPRGWVGEALAGRRRVVQREAGAGSQRAFVRAVAARGTSPRGEPPGGPRAAGHLDAARTAARLGMVAVTIEPAARALGLAFQPLETHVAELWTASAHREEGAVRALGEVLTQGTFQRRLAAVGGYDLQGCGERVA